MSRDRNGRFKTGNIGGPGRPAGSKNRLAERFVADFCADWAQHGAAVITTVRAEYPVAYFRTAASLVPREMPPFVQNEYSRPSDEELADRLIELGTEFKQSINNPSTAGKKTIQG
jgi:hypothetical protein